MTPTGLREERARRPRQPTASFGRAPCRLYAIHDRRITGLARRDSAALGALATALGVSGLLWLAATLQAWIHSSPAPMFSGGRVISVLLHPDQPAAAWGHSGGSTPEFWCLAFALGLSAGGAAYAIHRG